MKSWWGGPSSARWHFGGLLVFVTVLRGGVWSALGAELQLRETLLQAQRDRVTATLTAVVDHIGASAHPIGEDCDQHVPLRSRDINVPFIGEVKNACSEIPSGASQTHWSDRMYEETRSLSRAPSASGLSSLPPGQRSKAKRLGCRGPEPRALTTSGSYTH